MDEFQQKVVVVTGASEGIGRALCQQLAALGARLVLVARHRQRLLDLAATLPGEHLVLAADLCDEDQCLQVIIDTLAHYHHLDILINNAGITMWSRFDELEDLAVLERLMAVNYLAPARLTHAALPALKAASGQIVVVSSLAGITGVPTRSGYCASKHAVMGLFDSLRIELMDQGVAVTLLCPDFVVSEIHKRAIGCDGQALGVTPMQEAKIMTSDECAAMMLPAIAGRHRQLIMSRRGRLGRWLKLIKPLWIDKLAKKAIESGH
ncbi:SDR family oxidoreductase [Shewanella sp. NIFS-20-20]|uniref:SDR family oxidoreductase n=1 Tax=Shewanella sp. NIFS-20-20 TaxID=2853806 RepID=UPI001C437A9F|nr:SDR family oxidoreductase [Shewanella sp. NIFS-20-20]MBV7316484.1 SDR family oxidoreductase [Shewanella sp. NIFS-20-20]